MAEDKSSRRTPPARSAGTSPGTPPADDTPDTSDGESVGGDTAPVDTGPADAVVEPNEPAGSQHDTVEIPTGIDVEVVPASSPTEDRAVLLARLQLLETENARLRAGAPSAAVPRPRRKVGRSTAAVVLILIGALLAPVAVVGSWARGLVVDTERYVDTVAPIAQDPLVQSAVSNRITVAVVDALNVEELTTQATDAVADLDLPPWSCPGGHVAPGAAAGGDHRVHPQERHQDRQLGRVRERLGGGEPGRARADRRDAAR